MKRWQYKKPRRARGTVRYRECLDSTNTTDAVSHAIFKTKQNLAESDEWKLVLVCRAQKHQCGSSNLGQDELIIPCFVSLFDCLIP